MAEDCNMGRAREAEVEKQAQAQAQGSVAESGKRPRPWCEMRAYR